MKKIRILVLFILTLLMLSIFFSILIKKNSQTDDHKKIQITSTIFPYYSIADDICSFNANNIMLLKPGMESHTYEPTFEDITSIKNSDIFIYTGGESDKWIDTILNSINTDKTKIIKLMEYIEPISEQHHNHSANDEHIWTSPKNAKKIAEVICETVCAINPDLEQEYQKNADKLIYEIDNLDKHFEDVLKTSDKTVIFADRFPFLYFAKDYNLNYISAFPSCAEESEPSVQTITNIINTIKEQNIKKIFCIEFSNQKIADSIASETGVSKLLFHSCHNVTAEEFNEGASYVSLMNDNLNNLKEAMK